MIDKYIEAILNKDYKALSLCFSQNCQYFDSCPSIIGYPDYHLYGRNGIEMYFHNKFVLHGVNISDYVVENDNTVNFIVKSDGTYLFARATIEKFSPEGLIQMLTVRPA